MKKSIMVYLILILVLLWPTENSARRDYLTPEQKTRLSRIHTIFVTVLALSEKGPVSADSIRSIVRDRFEALGFQVVTDPAHSQDVEVHVLCEEVKRQQGVTRYGGDAELLNTPDRLWHGPACQLSYRLEGRDLGWVKEVRIAHEDNLPPSEISSGANTEVSVFDQLAEELTRLDFPVLLLSEWGHRHRLVELLTAPETTSDRQLLILDLLRQFPTSEALPHLLALIQDGRHPEEAIGALSGLGREVVPHLLRLFENSEKNESIRAAAAKGLGRIMRADGHPEVTAILRTYLAQAVSQISSSADIEFPVLTEVVWALGSIHHLPTFHLIDSLQNRIWTIYDSSPEMNKLREVVSVVYKYLDFNQL
jgi:hypothetical protein